MSLTTLHSISKFPEMDNLTLSTPMNHTHLQSANSIQADDDDSDASLPVHNLGLQITLGIYCVTISAIGLPTSLLIVTTIATFRELRTLQNAFVASLVSRDVVIIGLVLPIFYADFMLGYYPFGKSPCMLQLGVAFSISLGSVMELMNIAVSRYVKICCPIGTYRHVYNKRNTIIFISLTWTLSFLFGVPVATKYGHLDGETGVCSISKGPLKAVATLGILSIAVMVTLICYLSIWRTVQRAKENLKKLNEGPRRHRAVHHNFQIFLRDFLVFIIYFLLLMPFILLNSFGLSSPRDLAWDLAKLMSFTNNFTNCLIYGLLNRQIRHSFFRLLCRKRRMRSNVVAPYTISVSGMTRVNPSLVQNNKLECKHINTNNNGSFLIKCRNEVATNTTIILNINGNSSV